MFRWKCEIIKIAVIAGILGSEPAFAYVGPGIGFGLVGAILGVVLAIALMLFGLVYYPAKNIYKKLIKKEKKQKADDLNDHSV